MTSFKAAAALAILHVFSVLAIDLAAPIVGCAEVDCPTSENSTSAQCQVADRTFTLIGLANVDTPVADEDFTWTQGFQARDISDEEDRQYEKNFYLGSPQGFDIEADATKSGYGVCALFFTEVSDQVKFEDDNPVTSVGTCNDALNTNCVEALLKQATDVAGSLTNSSTADACEMLRREFSENLASQCPQFATGDRWQGLEVEALTGSDAPQPLTDAENATSNCYPTLPKSNSLTYVASFNTSGDALIETVADISQSITPILTLFFPQNASDDSTLQKPEARLTCLKGVGETDAAVNTSSTTDENRGSAGVMLLSPKSVTLVSIMVIAGWILG